MTLPSQPGASGAELGRHRRPPDTWGRTHSRQCVRRPIIRGPALQCREQESWHRSPRVCVSGRDPPGARLRKVRAFPLLIVSRSVSRSPWRPGFSPNPGRECRAVGVPPKSPTPSPEASHASPSHLNLSSTLPSGDRPWRPDPQVLLLPGGRRWEPSCDSAPLRGGDGEERAGGRGRGRPGAGGWLWTRPDGHAAVWRDPRLWDGPRRRSPYVSGPSWFTEGPAPPTPPAGNRGGRGTARCSAWGVRSRVTRVLIRVLLFRNKRSSLKKGKKRKDCFRENKGFASRGRGNVHDNFKGFAGTPWRAEPT